MFRDLLYVRLLGLVVIVLFLSSCGHNSLSRTIWAAVPALNDGVDAIPLRADRSYLRVAVRGRAALMVLGYRDTHPNGDIDTWYSSEGEALRLQNGRVLSTSGLETDWRTVRWPTLPSWKQLREQVPFSFRRERDEMPGYRFGVVDDLILRRLVLPEDTELVGWEPQELEWYEERKVGAGGTVPPALYALAGSGDTLRVVYSEQCLAANLCLAWQEWPVKR
jgi:hypothetical protein